MAIYSHDTTLENKDSGVVKNTAFTVAENGRT